MHAVDRYPRAVIDGDVPASEQLRLACRRHFADLDRRDWRWKFDEKAADRALRFFRDVLTLKVSDGSSVPFQLFPWQEFLVGSAFGWVDKGDPGIRRFKKIFVLSGRGSGKSPLAAGMSVYATFFGGNRRAQGFILAATADQGSAVADDCGRMVDAINEKRSPANRLRVYSRTGRVLQIEMNAGDRSQRLTRLSSDVKGRGHSGAVMAFGAVDELHEHSSDAALSRLLSSMKEEKPTPMIFVITNAGVASEGVCWEWYLAAKRNLDPAQSHVDERELDLLFEVDPADNPLKDERCWHKAGPSLAHGVPSIDLYQDEVTRARGNPSAQAEVERALFCRWTSGANPWITHEDFTARMAGDEFSGQAFPSEEELKGMRCYVGIDLSQTTDLSAVALCWVDSERGLFLRVHSFMPEEGAADKERKDHLPYLHWQTAGLIDFTPGKTVKYSYLAERIAEWRERYDIRAVCIDPYRMNAFLDDCQRLGVGFYKHGELGAEGTPVHFCWQGFRMAVNNTDDFYMPECINALEERLLNGGLLMDSNPLLARAAVASELLHDKNANRHFSKKDSRGRIDPIVAGAMAVGCAAKMQDRPDIDDVLADWYAARLPKKPDGAGAVV